MKKRDYELLLRDLEQRYIASKLGAARRRWMHGFDEFGYELDRATRAARVLRFVERECATDEDVYETLTPDRLRRAVIDATDTTQSSIRIAEECGFVEAADAHLPELLDGLLLLRLPMVDRQLMGELGSASPDGDLRLLAVRARRELLSLTENRNRPRVSEALEYAQDQIEQQAEEFRSQVAEAASSQSPNEPAPRKTRRWFKGFSAISQGAALTMADVGMAAGMIGLPVSPETQSWGAILSVITGFGTVLGGVGELRNE